MSLITAPKPRQRAFLPEDFKITVWSKLRPYYNELQRRPIDSVEALEQWMLDWNELSAISNEDFNWRYIRTSLDSNDEKSNELYQYAVQELIPRINSVENKLDKKLLDCPLTKNLDKEKYFIHLRLLRNNFEIFREENIELQAEDKLASKGHGELFSKMMIEMDGEEKTIQQVSSFLENNNREIRAKAFQKIAERILKDTNPLDELMTKLVQTRHQIALNAGFENFRDYQFQALGRFDYEVNDCMDFHEAVAKEIQPLNDELMNLRKRSLKVEHLRPWDLKVDQDGNEPLSPFNGTEELIEKSIVCLNKVDPYFGECLSVMKKMGHLDLDSKSGKRPGGYNMPLPMSGVPFVFMNAANTIKDVSTMLHESGHAVHSFLTKDYKLNSQRAFPSEVAELAAMTMELITMDYWGAFYKNEEDLRRAKIWQLEKCLNILPWIATIDKFQHWIYTNPTHNIEERKNAWLDILKDFSSEKIDWTGFENYKEILWQRQLHIFEVPFYYIEYGFAQLGAIAIWKNYKTNPQKTIMQYKDALKLGYTKSIGEIYQTAGIEFNFSKEYVSELGAFVKQELEQLIFQPVES